MHKELIQLYRRFNQHERALAMLVRHREMFDSPLRGHLHTVEYLQGLGERDIAIIFKYAEAIVKLHPEDGLTIFTGPGPTISSRDGGPLPIELVIDHLSKANPDLLIPYIEFFALHRGPATDILESSFSELDLRSLHSRLAKLYMERYKRLRALEDAKGSIPINQLDKSETESPGSHSLLGGLVSTSNNSSISQSMTA